MNQLRKIHLFWGDVVMLYLALFLTLVLRYGSLVWNDNTIISSHVSAFSLIFGLWLLVFFIANLYEFVVTRNNIEFFNTLGSAFLVNTIIAVVFFYFFFPSLHITPRTNLFIFLAISGTLISTWRYYFNHLLKKTGFRHNIVVVGRNQQSEELHHFLRTNNQLGNVLPIIDIDKFKDRGNLADFVREHRVKTVILSPEAYKIPRLIEIFYNLGRNKIRFFNLSDYFERVTGKVPLGAIDQTWFLQHLSGEQATISDVGKRVVDVLFSCIIGLITLPLYPIIVLAIRLDSEGPIFYKQKRVGHNGTTFTLVKFRNMIKDAEKHGASLAAVRPTNEDPRITRIGKLLRLTRLDELPQIWNVLRGEMSIVGPRPERPEFHEDLKAKVPFYEERYIVKPGLTGWAQVKYKLDFKGGLTIGDTAEKLKYDLYYIKNRTLILDLAIILKTVNILLKKILNPSNRS